MGQSYAKRSSPNIINLPTDMSLVGAIKQWGSASIPTGWMNCDGSAISRTTYSDLFAILSTTWGTGDGSTTFNIPDLRGTSIGGVGAGTGYTTNETYVLATKYNDQIQGHWHGTYYAGGGGVNAFDPGDATNLSPHNGRHTGNPFDDGTNGTPRTGTVTRGKRVGVYFIIKAINTIQSVYAQGVDGATLSLDGTASANSDSLVMSQKATRTYITSIGTYGRRTNGLTNGSSYTGVIIYSTAGVASYGSDISYNANSDQATKGSNWKILTAGIYSVSVTVRWGGVASGAIRVASAVDNNINDANSYASFNIPAGDLRSSASWTGYLSANMYVWVWLNGTVGTSAGECAFTIARVL